MINYLLDSSNAQSTMTYMGTAFAAGSPIDGVPLGKTVGGEVATKVIIVGSASGVSSNQVQGTAADNAFAVGNPVQTGGVAVTGATYSPGYAVGDAAVFAIDKDSGGLLVVNRTLTTTDNVTATPVASSGTATAAYATSKIFKASAGRVFSINGYNSKGSAQFIQLHDSATLPADTAVPLAILTAPATGNFSIDFGPLGIPCANGIVVCNSSTGPAKTIGSADVWITASFT